MASTSDFLLYDGACPFCATYTRMQRLRAAGVNLRLQDARDEPELVEKFREVGLDVNEGMILSLGSSVYFGADAIHAMALLTGPTGFANRILAKLFSNRAVARALYPAMRTGRNATLRVLGHQKI